MSADSDTEEDFFDELKQQEGSDSLEAPCATAEDLDSLESHSSTDSKLDGNSKLPSKFKSPVTEALKRVFRSRSSSPKISSNTSNNSKDTSHKGEEENHDIKDHLVVNEEYATCSDNDDNDCFEISTKHFVTSSSTMEKLSGKSLTHLNSKTTEGLDVKPMVTSRSFSCLQSSIFKGHKNESTPFCKRKSEDTFKSFRLKVRKRMHDNNKSVVLKDTPKVFISIDDDHPRTPEEEVHPSLNYLIDENSDEFDENLVINENDGLETVQQISPFEKVSETSFTDKEKQAYTLKSDICSKSSLAIDKPKEKVDDSQIRKQQSLESDTAHSNDEISPANSIDLPINHDKIPSDSKLKMLRKFTLSLQSKDKNKSNHDTKIEGKDSEDTATLTTTKGDDTNAKCLHNENNSSEESIPSIPDKHLRKGKFRELSNFLIREHNSSTLKKLGEESGNEEVPGENSLSVGCSGSKNSKTFGEKVAEYLQRGGSRLQEQQRRLKSQIWSSVVTIVLVKGKNLTCPWGPRGRL
ncbi:hypothetical protein Avbf_07267 [Armadillidium vulgare]|nr:hypothetical protein Avbf_07267 [Armadillidium vulgare]